ncbi:MAG: hypothetical protein AAGE92_06835 [Cyanobacteria bacterium P01_G01_bin.4]
MPTDSDWNDTLSCWMARADCLSWAQLQHDATLSRYRIQQLRQCQLSSWPLQAMQNLCAALDIPLVELLAAANAIDLIHPVRTYPDGNTPSHSKAAGAAPPCLSSDTHRQATLQTLEPLLRQLPTAAYAVQHHNLSAAQLLKILKPLESLLAEWNVTQLGAVGQVVPFDPTWQSSLTDTEHKRDTLVSIRYVGYRVGRRIWLKAQVRVQT